MRRTLATLLIVLLFAPELPARSNRDWENVKKLKHGTSVQILLWSGENLSGEIDAVSDAGLRLSIPDRSVRGASWLREADRASIRMIVRVRHHHLPDPHRWMRVGTVAGTAIGATAGAVADVKQGDNYHWLEGAFGGALAGFAVSDMALGAVAIVDSARTLSGRKVVYEDTGNHTPQASSSSDGLQP
jgi:outer membrane lipoprotein SlyB